MDINTWQEALKIYDMQECNVAVTLSTRRSVNGSLKSDFDIDLGYRKFINMLSRKILGRNKGTIKNICFREYGTVKRLHLHSMLQLPDQYLTSLDITIDMLQKVWAKQHIAYTKTKQHYSSDNKPKTIIVSARDFHAERIYDNQGWFNYCCKNRFSIDKVVNIAATYK